MKKIIFLLLITFSYSSNCSATSWFSQFFGTKKPKKQVIPKDYSPASTPPLSISSSSNSLSRSNSNDSFSSSTSSSHQAKKGIIRQPYTEHRFDQHQIQQPRPTYHSRTPSPQGSVSGHSSSTTQSWQSKPQTPNHHPMIEAKRDQITIMTPVEINAPEIVAARKRDPELNKYFEFPVIRIMQSFDLDKSITEDIIFKTSVNLATADELKENYAKKKTILHAINQQEALLKKLNQKIQLWQSVPQRRRPKGSY